MKTYIFTTKNFKNETIILKFFKINLLFIFLAIKFINVKNYLFVHDKILKKYFDINLKIVYNKYEMIICFI
ncbi:hypothetical protein HMPREF3181_01045 [Parvimonas sp. KA00067]|nr:hypothetical protein HMPREF3181_01045 [Parvimonas sp. KA00067]